MRVLVTGASGFLGKHIVDSFVRRGNRVRVLSRDTIATYPDSVEVWAYAGLDDQARIMAAAENMDVLIHLAGRAHQTRERAADPLAEFRRVNVDGSLSVAAASLRAGVRRLVFLSSIAAVGGPCGVFDDETAPRPTTPYGISKLEAEQGLRRLVESTGAELVSLRPPAVLGARMRGNPRRLMTLVRRGIPLPVGSMDAKRSFVFVENLVEAAYVAASCPVTGALEALVTDGTMWSTRELVEAMGVALGTTARVFSVPPGVLKAVAKVGDSLGRVFPFPVSSYELERLASPLLLSSTRLPALGFRPIVGVEEGIRRAAAGF